MDSYKTILKKVAKANELITWFEAYLSSQKASANDIADLISEVGDILKIEIDLDEWEEDLKSAPKKRIEALRADLDALEGVTLGDDVSALYNKVRAKMNDEAEADKVMRRLVTMVALVNSEVAKVKEVAESYIGEDDGLNGGLGTPKAKRYFPLAVKDGFIVRTENGYRRGEGVTKADLAYLLDKVYSDGSFPEGELDKLFGESRIGKARNKLYDNKDGTPRGAARVDRILQQ